MSNRELKNKLKALILILVIVTLLLTEVHANPAIMNAAQQFIVSLILGAITSAIAASILLKFGAEPLKKWLLVFEYGSFKFSVTCFAIATAILEKILFH